MPGGDRTGPQGIRAMTGRGAGYCAGYDVPGYANPIPGYGFGRGWGRGGFGRGFGMGGGRGWRHSYYATGLPGWYRGTHPGWGWWGQVPYQPPIEYARPEEEMSFMKEQAKYFSQALKDINRRIKELEGQATPEKTEGQ